MRVQLFKYWDRIRSGFWFVPAVMAAGAVALALISVEVDAPLTHWLSRNLGWKFTGGAEGASAVLGVIAGSMITVAGVVFSMTLVTMSLALSQLGPRLVRNLMRDTTTQVVLGTFIATFLYCLLVLRMIRRVEEVAFVPHLSVALGVLFAVNSVGVLIWFIHHVSVSIQANEISARVSHELIEGIDRLFPEPRDRAAQTVPPERHEALSEAFAHDAPSVEAAEDGYLQFIDVDNLLSIATEHDLVVRLERRPGSYVVAREPLAAIQPRSRVTDRIEDEVRGCFVLGHQRTPDQDIEFGVNQLVEIAVLALSPGRNDPFTAMTCVDQLGSVLSRLAARDVPSPLRHDERSQVRVIARTYTFAEVTDAAFNQIRHYSRSSRTVTVRLLETISVIASFARRSEDRATLRRHAEAIARGAIEALSDDDDRRAVESCRRAAIESCDEAVAASR